MSASVVAACCLCHRSAVFPLHPLTLSVTRGVTCDMPHEWFLAAIHVYTRVCLPVLFSPPRVFQQLYLNLVVDVRSKPFLKTFSSSRSKPFLRSHLRMPRGGADALRGLALVCLGVVYAIMTLSLSSYTDPGHYDSLAPARTRFLATQPQQSTPTAIQSTSAPPPPPASPPRRRFEAQMAHDVWLSDES